MKRKILALLTILTTALPPSAFAVGRIQNEDVKSLSDIKASVLTTTGNLSTGSACITSIGSTTGLATGQFIYDTTTPANIPAGTTIAGLPGTCSAGQVQMSANGTTATGDTITFGGQLSQLVNDLKIYDSTNQQQLSASIASGILGGAGSGVQYLSNPGFESGTGSWTVTTGTLTSETTTVQQGSKSAKVAASSQTSLLTQDVTPTVDQTNGYNFEAGCWVNTTLTNVQVCERTGGSNGVCTSVASSGNWAYYSVPFVGPSNGTSVGVQVGMTGSGTGNFFVDNCYVGPARTLTTGTFVTPWSTSQYSMAPSASFGTTTAQTTMTRRNGNQLEFKVIFTAGTTTAATASIAMPSGLNIDTNGNITAFVTTVGFGQVYSGSTQTPGTQLAAVCFDGSDTSNLYISQAGADDTACHKQNASTNFNSGYIFQMEGHVPVKQFSDQPFNTPSNTPASWSGYNSGVSAGCSSSSSTYADPSNCTSMTTTQTQSRNMTCSQASGPLPGITCNIPKPGMYRVSADVGVANANASTTVSFRLVDGSGTVIDPGKSNFITSVDGGNSHPAHLEGTYNATSVSSITFKVQLATNTGTAEIITGPAAASGTANVSWVVENVDSSNATPFWTGSVTSNDTTKGFHMEFATIGTTNGSTACTASPCSFIGQSGTWISSFTRQSTGNYTATFATGEFSSTPTCVVSCAVGGSSTSLCVADNIAASSNSTTNWEINTSTGSTAQDAVIYLMCMGNR